MFSKRNTELEEGKKELYLQGGTIASVLLEAWGGRVLSEHVMTFPFCSGSKQKLFVEFQEHQSQEELSVSISKCLSLSIFGFYFFLTWLGIKV